MENEKKAYETPEVTKVEFDASDRITASMCQDISDYTSWPPGTGVNCLNL